MRTRIHRLLPRAGTALLLASIVGFALTASPGFAIGPGGGPGPGSGGGKGPGIPPPGTGGGGPPSTQPIPEISPGAAASALLLVTGGTLILTDRFRRRHAPPAHEPS
jgi:hypothetical protein